MGGGGVSGVLEWFGLGGKVGVEGWRMGKEDASWNVWGIAYRHGRRLRDEVEGRQRVIVAVRKKVGSPCDFLRITDTAKRILVFFAHIPYPSLQ